MQSAAVLFLTFFILLILMVPIGYSIGIAMGEEKYSGILGALHGRYINCLVTNRETAELLLK